MKGWSGRQAPTKDAMTLVLFLKVAHSDRRPCKPPLAYAPQLKEHESCEGPPLEGTSFGKRLNHWIISAFEVAELRAKMVSAKVSAAFGAESEVATRSGPCGPA